MWQNEEARDVAQCEYTELKAQYHKKKKEKNGARVWSREHVKEAGVGNNPPRFPELPVLSLGGK